MDVSPAYHLDARAENVMAVAAWALGAAFLLFARARAAVAGAVARAGDRFGPRRWYGVALRALNAYSDRLHDAEVRDLRNSIAAVLVPTGVLVALGFAFTPTRGSFTVGSVETEDLPILVLLVLCVAAAFTVVRDPGRLRPVLALSVLGFALAGVYAVAGAPDVALVAVLVETIFTLVFVGVFSRLPQPPPAPPARVPRSRGWRNVLAGLVAGVASFAVIWATLSRTSPERRRRGRADRADARRARRRRRHGDPRRLPRARHDGRDHRAGGRRHRRREPAPPREELVSTVIDVVAPRLLGPAVMVAAAIIVKGYTDVGDGFSAGVIVALAIALRYVTFGTERAERSLPVLRHAPVIAAGGLLLALAVGFLPVAAGDPPFTHRPGPGADVVKLGTLELISAVAFDVGVFLLVCGVLVTLVHQLARLVEESGR